MKIKPDDLEIPCDDPFRHDLLDRKTTILTLTNLLRNLESPYTMSIDAAWGNGKTTFLEMWKKHLKKEGFPVVGFNAWETDFAGSPLVALISELHNTLKCYDDQHNLGLETFETALPRLLKIVLTKAIPGLISLAGGVVSIQTDDPSVALAGTTFASGLSVTLDEAISDEPQTQAPEPVSYSEAKEAIRSFKNALQDIAESLSENYNNNPLIIAIDELDRCRPSYAVELLEIAKHLFSVDHVVFVLAIDRSQLTHAVKALYGSEFDSTGYLRRFIDLDFRLPNPNRINLMTQMLGTTGVSRFFEQNPGHSWGTPDDIRNLLFTFMGPPIISLRQIQQALYRLGLVLASLDSPSTIAYAPIGLMLALRTIDPEAYTGFFRSNMTDREVSDRVFKIPGMESTKSTSEGSLFDALLIIAQHEFTITNRMPTGPVESSLHNHILKCVEDESNPLAQSHAKRVVNHLNDRQVMFDMVKRGHPVGFYLAMQRIEMFSDDLLGDDT